MNYIAVALVAYLTLLLLNWRQQDTVETESLQKFTVRAIKDFASLGAIAAALPFAATAFLVLYPNTGGLEDIPVTHLAARLEGLIQGETTAIFLLYALGLFLGIPLMLAPTKGFWDIVVDGDEITVIKGYLFRRRWKFSQMTRAEITRGGVKCFVAQRRRKAFFVDNMTDNFSNFMERLEKEQVEIAPRMKKGEAP